MLILAVAFGASALTCHLIVRSARWHLPYTADSPGTQPQKSHAQAVPRIGGLGPLIGIVAVGMLLPLPPQESGLYWLLVFSLIPAFLGGFLEDVTRRVGPGIRLLLTVVTAAFAYSLAGVHFDHSHMLWLDQALAFQPFGYLALLLAVAGVAHATNIIDGYNGLAAGVAIIVLVAMGLVARQSGDELLALLCYGTAAATLGFLVVNYPSGRLFLGDGGAYLLGCAIALAAALLILRNREISPWFPLALVIHPVWETLFSMVRRAMIDRRRIGGADVRHLHSLVYRRLTRRWVRGHRAGDRSLRNSLTALPFWAFNLLLATCAVTWAQDTRVQQGLAAASVALYCFVYWRMTRTWRGRRRANAVAASAGPPPESRRA